MHMDEAIAKVQKVLYYQFNQRPLLQIALSHSSYVHEHPQTGTSYERLEFLGDAVLDLIVAKLLYETMPTASEGVLSERRAFLVCRETLALLAEKLALSDCVLLGAGQQASGGVNSRILAEVFESLVGAVFLDAGYDATVNVFQPMMRLALQGCEQTMDFKTSLQQHCHRLGLIAPEYQLLHQEGPPHARRFTCAVMINGLTIGTSTNTSKKRAEQQCAQQALLQLHLHHKQEQHESLRSSA